jgi:hypothetical protein
MQTFKSKIDGRIWIPLGLLLVAVTLFLLLEKVWLGVTILLLVVVFILYLIVNTSYTITADGNLIVVGGFLIREKIRIASIKKVVHTSNPLASPALSLRRLELWYNKYDKIMISPENEGAFLSLLKTINPEIVIQ